MYHYRSCCIHAVNRRNAESLILLNHCGNSVLTSFAALVDMCVLCLIMSCCVTWGLWTMWYLLYLQGDWRLKISHMVSRSGLCDEAPTKVGGPRLGRASLVGDMFCVITHRWVREALTLSVTLPTREGPPGTPSLKPSEILLLCLFP